MQALLLGFAALLGEDIYNFGELVRIMTFAVRILQCYFYLTTYKHFVKLHFVKLLVGKS